MAGRILGIDLSDGTATLCLTERRGRSRVVAGYASFPLPQGGAEDVAQAVADAVGREGFGDAGVILGLDSREALVRDFVFPFSGSAQVRQASVFELEQDVPLPLDTMQADVVAGQRSGGGRSALAVAVRREPLAELVEALADRGLSPSVCDLDCFSLARAVRAAERLRTGGTLILDLGESRTLIAGCENGSVRFAGTLSEGVGALIAELGNEVGGDEARRAVALADLTRDTDGSAVRDAIRTFLFRMCAAAERMVSARGWEPERVVLVGETAQLPGVADSVAENLGLPAFLLAADPAVREALGREDLPESAGLVRAWGLTLGADSLTARHGANFLNGSLAAAGGTGRFLRPSLYAAAVLLLLGLSFGASVMAEAWKDRQEMDRMTEAAAAVFHETLPDVRKGLSRMQNLSILRSRIAQLRGDMAGEGGQPSVRALAVLNEVSGRVPEDVDVMLETLNVEQKRVRLTGNAGAYADVEAARNALAASRLFSGARILGASAQKKGGRVRFELQLDRSEG